MSAPPLTFRVFTAHPAHMIALGFGSGMSPWAPGTVGTLFAIPLGDWLRLNTTDVGYLLVVALFVLGGAWAADRTGRDLGVADHGGIVIDEIAAMLLMLFFTGTDLARIALAFLLFRLFDILKFGPASWLNRRKGAFFVVADDLAAGLYAAAAYRGIAWLTG